MSLSWLKAENLNINWKIRKLKFNKIKIADMRKYLSLLLVLSCLMLLKTENKNIKLLKKYNSWKNVFNKYTVNNLSSYYNKTDYNINLIFKTALLYDSLYNITENKFNKLKHYINKNIK